VLALLGVGNGLPLGSYAPTPWLAYPLLGCLAGRWLRGHDLADAAVRRRATFALGVLGGGCAALGAGLVMLGQPAYRWGAMSIAFFVLSFATVALAATAMLVSARTRPRLVAFLIMSGPASFAAVPIHYWLIHLLAPGVSSLSSSAVAVASLLLVLVVIELARRFGTFASACVARLASPRAVVFGGVGLALSLAWAALSAGPSLAIHFACAGQLLICGLLVNRVAARHKPASAAVAAGA
jgi:hypothetical protein